MSERQTQSARKQERVAHARRHPELTVTDLMELYKVTRAMANIYLREARGSYRSPTPFPKETRPTIKDTFIHDSF